jgi:DNA-binding CsgD family transcriptional regulator
MVQASLIAIETDEDSAPTIDLMAVNSESLAYPPLRAGVAHLLADAGRRDEALRHLPGIVAHVVGDPGREASWLLTAALTADAVAAVGDLGLAETLLPVVLPHADRIAVDGLGLHCHGCLARPLARLALLLGRRDEALQLLLLAQERDSSAGLGRFVLDGAVDLLAMRGSDGECSDEQLESEVASLVDEAIRAGFTRTARRAQTLLHRGGSVLTERQYDVLVALADGLTYKTAGERLGFSHSTIRHEAIRVYTTLGVHDRDEAVRVARRRGLLPT